ncbi:thioesterase [Streptomyces lunaelactis]|uniref:thioesterase II family protein n=1 Tax=Streptomyces lunaelactis TaxID=1535768 RepID=UPI001584F377|nr:alpha/beta fold hydrolase [Streptomyces lunaelactis]NUL01703.1 thioesterase [Streptomyces lunaelactis]
MTTQTRRSSGLVLESPFIWRARRPNSRHRLICFPHAGGGASAFADWVHALPAEIEVVAVQLPGRQNRILEDPATEVGPLVRDVTKALLPLLNGSFSFFGHSCGALLGYEVAQLLHAQGGPRPDRLFLSAQPSPAAAALRPKIHNLSEEEFRAEVMRLGGFDEEVALDEDAMDALIPTVLADFALWEQHAMTQGPLIDSPITAMVGESDVRAPLETIEGWGDHTDAGFEMRVYPGGHFYLFDAGTDAQVFEFLAQTLLAP